MALTSNGVPTPLLVGRKVKSLIPAMPKTKAKVIKHKATKKAR